nr:copia protein [Tanacetum cinerariifolium]
MSNTNNTMQTQTSNTLHNAIMEAGGKDRPPILAPESTIQVHMGDKAVPVTEGSSETTNKRYMDNYKNVSQDIRDQLNAEAEAIQLILTGIDNDIYSTVDACPNACEMWKAIKRLKQVNEIRAERIVRTANPLALVAQQQPVYHPQNHPTHYTQKSSTRSQQAATRNRGKAIVNSPPSIYDQEPSMVAEDDEMSKDKEIDKLMALISLSFKKIYKPTNNNIQTSSNTSRTNQDNSPRISRGTGYDNQRIGNVGGARETVAYHKEKMLLCKQEEARFTLNAEQAYWRDDTDDEPEDQELEAHYMYMAQIQKVSPNAANNSGPIFDTEPLQKVLNNDHYNVFAIESKHPEQSKSVNDIYLIEQDEHNVTIDSLDMSYDRKQIDQNDDDYLANERVIPPTSVSRPQLKSNQIEDRVMLKNSQRKKQEVEDHHRNVKLSKNKTVNSRTKIPMAVPICTSEPKRTVNQSVAKPVRKIVASESTNQKPGHTTRKLYEHLVEIILFIVDSGCSKHMMGNLKLLINFVEKFLGTVKFRNDQITLILGYGDLNDIMIGLPKLKFVKDHICSSCELGKAKRKSFQTKTTPSSKRRLQLLHLDLCGPMRAESINGKKYVLVIIDDYSRYTCTHFLRSKDETPKVLFDFLRLVQRELHAQVRTVRTDKGTEFLNKIFIRTLLMKGLITKRPLLEHLNKTALSKDRTVHLDGENLDKMKEKGDACIFVGYSTQSRAYRVFDKKTRVILETIHVNFDELPHNVSPDPVPQCQRTTLEHDSLSPGPQCQENVPHAARTVTTSTELDLLFKSISKNAQVKDDGFINIFCTPMKDHPLEQVIGNSSQSVRTRRQLEYDGEMCMFALIVSRTEPKNIKEAMADSAWIKSMQEELHQFDRLDLRVMLKRKELISKNLLHQLLGWKLSGIQIHQSPHGIFINQAKYAQEILIKHGMTSCDSVGTPMATKHLDADLSGTPVDQTKYRSMVGALMYLTTSRPDIMHATCYCARYLAKLTEKHLTAVKQIFWYLKDTIHMRLWYPKDTGFELTTFSYSDHTGCLNSHKSTSGGIQFLGGDKLVNWSSKKQDCTSMSLAEAEYVSLSTCCAQVLWMRTQLTNYGVHFDKIPMYCDSKAAIAISCNPVQHSRTKHIDVRYHFIKEKVEKGIVELFFVETKYQLADLFTKALSEDRFKYLIR